MTSAAGPRCRSTSHDWPPGEEFQVVDEPHNPANPSAIQLHAGDRPAGRVPDHLLDYVHKQREEGAIRVLVERANGPEIPWHLRPLARLECRRTT